MTSERLRKRVEQLLDEGEDAIGRLDWEVVRARAQAVLAIEPGNEDGLALVAVADRAQGGEPHSQPDELASPATPAAAVPDSSHQRRLTHFS